MKALRSLLMALALMALFAVPAFAQDDTVTLGFEVTGAGGCAEDTTFFGLVGPPFSEFSAIQLQDQDGDGVYMGSTEVGAGEPLVVQIVQGVGTVDTEFGTFPGEPVTLLASFSSSEDPQGFVEDRTLEAAADCDVPDSQQMPDNQQDGGKDTGAGKTPDNQQGGGGETVTKTFELTLDGDVPEGGEAFQVSYSTGGEAIGLVLCSGEAGATTPVCEGGETYRVSVDVPVDTTIEFAFERFNVGVFHSGTETINEDMTNTAWYTFGKGTGAGDEQETPDNQQEGEQPDTGAGEVPDNQQEGEKPDTGAGETPDNQQDDVQDDQQGEMPGELPDTGAGGLAAGASVPVGNAAAGLTMLVGAGYAVLRRR